MSKAILSFQPFEDRVLIDPVEIPDEEVTASGLVIQFNKDSDKTPYEGYVVAVGPGRVGHDSGVLHPMSVAVGDKVQWSKYSGHKLTIDGNEYLLMRQADILGKVIETIDVTIPASQGSVDMNIAKTIAAPAKPVGPSGDIYSEGNEKPDDIASDTV